MHADNRPSNEFNPCRGNPTRFAPFLDRREQCVPSLYAGSSLDSVIYETLFHDIPVRAKRKTVLESSLADRAHGKLETQRDISVASLRAPDLAKWNISRNSLIASPPRLYKETAAWAKAIHDQFPDVEGLVWTSNQCDPENAFLFFGDRVCSDDLRIVFTRDCRSDPSFLTDVRQAGRRSGITVAI